MTLAQEARVEAAVSVSATGSSPSFGQFGSSTLAFSGGQQAQGLAASIDSSLFTQISGSGAGGVGGGSDASMTALLAAYSATKSMSPVALAYLQQLPTSSTTSALL
jgi:hypothetical protein